MYSWSYTKRKFAWKLSDEDFYCELWYGYSLQGKPLKAQKLLVGGERVSCIAAMSMQGIHVHLVAIKIATGSVDGNAFYNFVLHFSLSSCLLMV